MIFFLHLSGILPLLSFYTLFSDSHRRFVCDPDLACAISSPAFLPDAELLQLCQSRTSLGAPHKINLHPVARDRQISSWQIQPEIQEQDPRNPEIERQQLAKSGGRRRRHSGIPEKEGRLRRKNRTKNHKTTKQKQNDQGVGRKTRSHGATATANWRKGEKTKPKKKGQDAQRSPKKKLCRKHRKKRGAVSH